MSRWIDRNRLSNKETKCVDGKILGSITEVQDDYVLTEGESKFYIPTYLIEKFEGNALWFKIDEEEAKSKFMMATGPARI